MIRNQVAFDESCAKKQQALDKKIDIATMHLPRIIAEKHDGELVVVDRDELRDILIRDGVLGSRWNARHIANAKKYNQPLNQWEQLTAETVVDQALLKAETDGKITVSSGRSGFRVRSVPSTQSISASPEDVQISDPDELYPLLSNLPPHRVADWDLQYAHE